MPSAKVTLVSVDPQAPDQGAIATASELITQGGLVVFPTSTFYGLGARAFDRDAVDRVFRVKMRDRQKPILILIASLSELFPLVRHVPATAKALMETFWPGKVTLVFEARDSVPENLTGGTGKIGVRLAGHPVAAALVRAAGFPITGTSANVAGGGGCTVVSDLDPQIREHVDLILDCGPLAGAVGSTVVDVTVSPPRVLREGLVTALQIGSVAGRVDREIIAEA